MPKYTINQLIEIGYSIVHKDSHWYKTIAEYRERTDKNKDAITDSGAEIFSSDKR